MRVMNKTFASRGRLAIRRTASATCCTSIIGSGERPAARAAATSPSASSVRAFPMSIWPLALHDAEGFLSTEECARDVRGDDSRPLRKGYLLERRRGRAHPGIVEEHV